ncbi:MAG: hypothetical protein ABSD08_13625 [Xanthobacteraceae bacterium]|jgi:hypothetical protein
MLLSLQSNGIVATEPRVGHGFPLAQSRRSDLEDRSASAPVALIISCFGGRELMLQFEREATSILNGGRKSAAWIDEGEK